MNEETRVTEMKNGQHIHVHIHMNGSQGQNEMPTSEALKGGSNSINVFLAILIIGLGFVVANKYGLLVSLAIPDSIANFHLNNLSPFPKAAMTLSTMQPVTMRCVALNIGIDMNGQPVPASDANIDSIPKKVCYSGCRYEMIPSQAWVGLENGMMSYVGKFKPIGETCNDGGMQNDGMQKTFLALVPLYMLKDYLSRGQSGDGKSDKAEDDKTAILPSFQVPFIDQKIQEAKEKVGAWIWKFSRLIILGVAVIVFLIGLLSNRLSRFLLILGSLSVAWYVY